ADPDAAPVARGLARRQRRVAAARGPLERELPGRRPLPLPLDRKLAGAGLLAAGDGSEPAGQAELLSPELRLLRRIDTRGGAGAHVADDGAARLRRLPALHPHEA